MDLSEFERSPTADSRAPLASPQTGAVGVASVVKSTSPVKPPDPRWPYLNRWSGGKLLSAPIGQLGISTTNSPVLPDLAITDSTAAVSDRAPVVSENPLSVTDSAKIPAVPDPSPIDFEKAPPVTGSMVIPENPPPVTDSVNLHSALDPTPVGCENLPPVIGSAKLPAAVRDPPLKSISVEEAATMVLPPETVGDHKQASPTLPPSRLGAWAKPLKLSSTGDHLSSVKGDRHKSSSQATKVSYASNAKEDAVRFPWAARMDPGSRNLYRAVEPEYLEDGTPKVTIPPHVLLQGLENQKEYVLGQFFRCSPPPGGLIYAVFNKVWGRNCKITIKKLGDSSYLFHIPEESTRNWVLQRGLWHVDDCLMFVAPWTPQASLAIPEIKTIPVWVTLKNIPSILYSIRGISHIASGLGAPMATHKPRLDPIFMGEAKILVEVELSKAFPPRVAADDKNGCIWMVDVEYVWLPSTCSRCGQLGHKVKRCLQPVNQLVATTTNTSSPTSEELPPTDPICTEILASTLLQTSQQPASSSSLVPSGHISYSAAVSQVLPTPTKPLVSNSMALLPATLPMASIVPQEVSTESPCLEIAPLALTAVSPRSLASSHREGKQHDTCLGTNQFASLASSGGDEVHSDSDVEPESMDFMTPPGKRILRDRPVKPTTKAIENSWQVKGRGKGGRGRGGRG